MKAARIEVTSIEERRVVAIESLKYAGIKVPEKVDVVLSAGLDVLPELQKEIRKGEREPFGFVFIDADWDNQWNYFDYRVKLSKGKGSVVYMDNTARQILESGFVGPEERDENVIPLVEMVGKDERVDAAVMQTVGAKDYDGFLMTVLK